MRALELVSAGLFVFAAIVCVDAGALFYAGVALTLALVVARPRIR